MESEPCVKFKKEALSMFELLLFLVMANVSQKMLIAIISIRD